jgi:hypothetical protein
MKAMKKIGAAALALAMLGTSMSSMAFAEEAEESYDFGGATVKVNWGVINPDRTEEEKARDAKYYEAELAIEEKYNIDLVYVNPADYGDDGYNLDEVVQTTISAGEGFTNILDMGPDKLLGMIAGGLVSEVEGIEELEVGSIYTDAVSWGGKCYGMSFDNLGDTYTMIYSRDYLEEIGMDVTPTDKFMAGEWSYDDMKEYLTEMKAKLPEGVYPISIHWNAWVGMSGAANGAPSATTEGVWNIKNEAFLDSLTFYRELIDEGLAHPVELGYDEETGELSSASAPWGTGDMNNSIVIANAEGWYYPGLYGQIGNWGIVYWPWGDNVTCEGDYTTLSENYRTGHVYWGSNVVLADAEKQTGISPLNLIRIAKDFQDMTNPAGAAGRHAAWEAEQAGEVPPIGYYTGEPRDFCTEQDIELYDWGHTRVIIDLSKAFSDSNICEIQRLALNVILQPEGVSSDARAVAQSCYDQYIEVAKEMGMDIIDGSIEVEEEIETEDSTEE